MSLKKKKNNTSATKKSFSEKEVKKYLETWAIHPASDVCVAAQPQTTRSTNSLRPVSFMQCFLSLLSIPAHVDMEERKHRESFAANKGRHLPLPVMCLAPIQSSSSTSLREIGKQGVLGGEAFFLSYSFYLFEEIFKTFVPKF